MAEDSPPLILCMENFKGEEVVLRVEPSDDFNTLLAKAKNLLGFDVQIDTITKNQIVSLTDNAYDFLLKNEKTLSQDIEISTRVLEQILEPNKSMEDLVYVLDDGTQINTSQIQFDNEDYPLDLTNEVIPFVKLNDTDYFSEEEIVFDTRHVKIVESPITKWPGRHTSPRSSFTSKLPFKCLKNNYNPTQTRFTYSQPVSSTIPEGKPSKTYTTLNTVTNKNKSPRSLIRDNFKNSTDENKNPEKISREEVLNMFKNTPVTAKPFDNKEKRHIRKTDPTRMHKKSVHNAIFNVEFGSCNQLCFICGKNVDNRLQKLYLFDNEDQKLHRSSPLRKHVTNRLKIICECCLKINFRPGRMKSSNQELGSDEYLVIRNNQQYIFEKVKNFTPVVIEKEVKPAKKVDKPTEKSIDKPADKSVDEITKEVIVVKDETQSSDVEIVDNHDIDSVIENLEEADEQMKEFLGKYENYSNIELKCRFCQKYFSKLAEVINHGNEHKHEVDGEDVFPCLLCDYGYPNFKWLKAHLKAAHEKYAEPKPPKPVVEKEKKQKVVIKTADIPKQPMVISDLCYAKPRNDRETKSKDSHKELKSKPGDQKHSKESNKENKSEDDNKKVSSEDFVTNSVIKLSDIKQQPRKRRCNNNKAQVRLANNKVKNVNYNGNKNNCVNTVQIKCKKETKNQTNEIVTCDVCSQSFNSKVRLKFHMQFHTADVDIESEIMKIKYSCDECKDTFESESELFDHVHFKHGKKSKLECPFKQCRKSFYLKATLTKHLRVHTDTRRYVCSTCGKKFLDKQTLDEHNVTHLNIKPYSCPVCGKFLTRRSRLRMHIRGHWRCTKRKLLACAVCFRVFDTIENAEEHIKTSPCMESIADEFKQESEAGCLSPSSGLLRCKENEPKMTDRKIKMQVNKENADRLISQVADEFRHVLRVVEIDKAFRCEYCEDVFYLEDGLNEHRQIHKGVKNPFTCHICKVSFATYSRCTTHKTTHGFYKRALIDRNDSSDSIDPICKNIMGFPVVKHFLCEDCGRSYLHWTYLQVHKRMKHMNQDSVYTCNYCELTFPNSWSIAYHRKKVHRINPDDPSPKECDRLDYKIPCRDCTKFLPNKTALYRHRQQKHSNDSVNGFILEKDLPKIILCAQCKKPFSDELDLQIHLITAHHTEIYCDVCLKSFETVTEFRKHKQTNQNQCGNGAKEGCRVRLLRDVSKAQCWSCPKCICKFRLRSDLRTHIRTKHAEKIVVLEMPGTNPTSNDILRKLKTNKIDVEMILNINKICYKKGVTGSIPNSERALSILLNQTPKEDIFIPTSSPKSTAKTDNCMELDQENVDFDVEMLLNDANAASEVISFDESMLML